MTITVVKPESMKLQKTFSGNNKGISFLKSIKKIHRHQVNQQLTKHGLRISNQGTIFETATNEELCIKLESLGIESLQITITHD